MQQNPSRSMMVMGPRRMRRDNRSRVFGPVFERALRIARYVADVKIGDEWLRNKTLCLTEI